jgi:hypothetical protein
MHGSLEVGFEIELCENKCKCRVCGNNVYPNELRGVLTGYENLYWADNYEGKVNEVDNFYTHVNCLFEMMAEKAIKIRREKYEEQLNKLEKIKNIMEDE